MGLLTQALVVHKYSVCSKREGEIERLLSQCLSIHLEHCLSNSNSL